MILATIITCPARWACYQAFRRRFEAVAPGIPLRTFQTSRDRHSPRGNSNLNARAALACSRRHLPLEESNWVLFLEDDVVVEPELAAALPKLVELGSGEGIDCWYLCNRRNRVKRSRRCGGIGINELEGPVVGSHALLIPRRHVDRILDGRWESVVDQCIFGALSWDGVKVFQVVEPVLARHVGDRSTYAPRRKQKLEVYVADQTNHHQAA